MSVRMLVQFILTLSLGQALWAQTSADREVVLLWPNGAPGSEWKTGDEEVRWEGDNEVVSGVHRPSLTVYLPAKYTGTGAAVIVAPGGSYRELWITHEGYRVGEWLSTHGIAAFVLKYRLPRSKGSTYTEDTALADMQRALRTVRARAREWGPPRTRRVCRRRAHGGGIERGTSEIAGSHRCRGILLLRV